MRLFVFVFVLFVAGCGQTQENKPQNDNKAAIDLLGTWELDIYLARENGKEEWKAQPDNIIYQKHITPTHFTWFSYDKEADRLLGAGGGSYTIEGNVYTENIEFFMPPGSNELGQSIPFTVEMKDGKWHHLGYVKSMEIDEDSGTPVRKDSSKIDEIWKRTEVASNNNQQIMGTWNLTGYRTDTSTSTMEYPHFIKYMKHITPTHFVWIKYNGEDDQIFEMGGGTYQVTDSEYVENVSMMFPRGTGVPGSAIKFSYAIEDERWSHMGYVNRIDPKSTNGERMDLLIDERWKKVKK